MNVLISIGLFFMGAGIGMIIMCCMIVSSDNDRYKEGYDKGRADERKNILEKVHTMYNVPGEIEADELHC